MLKRLGAVLHRVHLLHLHNLLYEECQQLVAGLHHGEIAGGRLAFRDQPIKGSGIRLNTANHL